MDEITIGDKLYVSSKRAAQITGYAKDYIGQLCREGRVEARLVGRNWYVLESALKAHRFGSEPKEPKKEEVQEPASPISTWKKPEYAAETPVYVPTLAPKAPVAQESEIGSPAIADMQSAWREWFQEKKTDNEDLETNTSPIPSESNTFLEEEAVEEAPVTTVQEAVETEEEIHINRIEEPQEEADDRVEIHRSYDTHKEYSAVPWNQPVQERIPSPIAVTTAVKPRNHFGIQLFLVVFAATVLLISVIGTGYADRFLTGTSINFGLQKSVIDFLGGKSEYKSTL